MRYESVIALFVAASLVGGCATVDVTKTGKGSYHATVADDIRDSPMLR